MFDVPDWSAGNVYVLCICCQVLVFEWSFWNFPQQWWICGICFSFPPRFLTTSCKPKYLVFNPTINTITNTNRVMRRGGGSNCTGKLSPQLVLWMQLRSFILKATFCKPLQYVYMWSLWSAHGGRRVIWLKMTSTLHLLKCGLWPN